MSHYNILVVDDDEAVGGALKDALELLDVYKVSVAHDGAGALKLVQQEHFDAYLVDQIMPSMSGTEFISALLSRDPDPLVYVITAEDDGVALLEAEKGVKRGGLPIRRYIAKPWAQSLFTVDLREDLRERELKTDLLNAVEIHIRQQRKVQDQLTRALDSLRSAERFGASMAGALSVVRGAEHEINNLNAGLHGYCARLADIASRAATMTPQENARELMELHPRMQMVAERLKVYTAFVASLGRAPAEPYEVCDADQIVNQVIADLRETIEIGQAIVSARVEPGCKIDCMPNQLRNALFQIVRNGVEALGKEPGSVYVEVHNRDSKTIIRISDTGRGIAPPDLELVFTPLFTQTKVYGGKGGPIAHRIIVENHGGSIKIESCTDQMVQAGVGGRGTRGTTVTITLPQARPVIGGRGYSEKQRV